MRIFLIAVVAFLLAGSAQAATPTNIGKCLELTNAHAINSGPIIAGLGLTPDQTRQIRPRLISFTSLKGFEGLDGIGLTDEQTATIMARLDALVASWNAHPLGWPCAAFTHRAKTVVWIKSTLVANGFRSASIRVTKAVPRQIQLTGIQDGIDVWITVARKGPKGVAIRLATTHSGGGTYAFVLPFVP